MANPVSRRVGYEILLALEGIAVILAYHQDTGSAQSLLSISTATASLIGFLSGRSAATAPNHAGVPSCLRLKLSVIAGLVSLFTAGAILSGDPVWRDSFESASIVALVYLVSFLFARGLFAGSQWARDRDRVRRGC